MIGFDRGSLRFDVRDEGPVDGPVAVLLHGFPQTSSAWEAVAPRLHRLGLRTLAFDQRGYAPGARPSHRLQHVVPELGGDVLALLDRAGVRRAHVVGHDWGGAVGWWLAGHHAHRVATLTVLSTPHPAAMARALVTSDQLLRSAYIALFQLPWVPEVLLRPSADGSGRLARTLVARGLDPGPARRYDRELSRPGALTGALHWYRAIPFARPGGIRRPVDVPTRLLWGAQDPHLNRTSAEGSGRYVRADYRLVVLAEAGHWLPEQHPDAVAAVVEELLDVDRRFGDPEPG